MHKNSFFLIILRLLQAFFRRCLQRTSPYKCDKGGNCIIDEQQKGLNCSACRLKKCQELGMSKEGNAKMRKPIGIIFELFHSMNVLLLFWSVSCIKLK